MMLSVFSYTYLPSVCFLWGGICPYHLPTFQLVGFIYIKWRQWHPTPVLLPGKSHGHRSLVGYSPWGRKESDTTERLHFHFSLSCIGEGNGNPLQYSCLENPRDRGAWWAAVYGVAQSRTRLKQLSSSSKSSLYILDTSPFFLYKSFLFFLIQVLFQKYVLQILFPSLGPVFSFS